MFIRKNIFSFGGMTVTAAYIEESFDGNDTAVRIYDRYKISVLLSDGLDAVKDEKLIKGGKGSILFFRPDELHFARFTRAGVHSFLNFYIPTELFALFPCADATLSFLTDRDADRINCVKADAQDLIIIESTAKKAIRALTADDSTSEMTLFSIMLQIILLCGKYYAHQKNHPSAQSIPNVVAVSMRYISENFEKKISLGELSAAARCSVTYLERAFKKHTGLTVYNYLIATRIGNAQMMLKNGATVTEACFASGFGDCSNFIRTFKHLSGKTPLAYRNEIFPKKAT